MNYIEWALSVKLAINSRGKMGCLTGETPKPKVGDTDKNKWQIENSLIIVWLINSMEPTTEKPNLFHPIAKDVFIQI